MIRDGKMRAAEPEENDLLQRLDASRSDRPAAYQAGRESAAAADEPAADPAALQVKALIAALLASIEDGVHRAKAHGLDDKLREIFERNFPEIAVPVAEPEPPASAPPSKSRALNLLAAEQVNLLLGLLNCIQAFDGHARRAKANGPQRSADEAHRDFLRALSEDLKAGAVTVHKGEKPQ